MNATLKSKNNIWAELDQLSLTILRWGRTKRPLILGKNITVKIAKFLITAWA